MIGADPSPGDRIIPVLAGTTPDKDGRMGKLAFHLDRRTRRGKTNSFRSAGYVGRHNLTRQELVLLYGDLEEGECGSAGQDADPRCSSRAASPRSTIYRENELPGLPGGRTNDSR